MSYYPATQRLIYSNITVPAGNTVAATTTETNFASSVVLPANSLVPGSILRIEFMGVYTTPGLSAPTTVARVKFGSTAVVTTPALMNIGGASNLGYSGFVLMTVVTSGASGSVRAGGTLHFATSNMASVTVVVPQAVTTIDTTVSQTLQLSVQFGSNIAGNSNTLNNIQVMEARPPKASN